MFAQRREEILGENEAAKARANTDMIKDKGGKISLAKIFAIYRGPLCARLHPMGFIPVITVS
jgi:hypothetical protein